MDEYSGDELDMGSGSTTMKEYWALFFQQVKTLLWKAWKYSTNNLIMMLIRFCFGILCIIFFGMILLFASSGEVKHPDTGPTLGGIPKCVSPLYDDSLSCNTLYYSPATPDVHYIMNILGQQNTPQLTVQPLNSTSMDYDIVSTNMTLPSLQSWVRTNPNVTQGAVYFDVDFAPLNVSNIRYTVVYNGTTFSDPISFIAPTPYMNYQYQTQVAVDRALITYFTGDTAEIDLAFKPFPSTTSAVIQGLLYSLVEVVLFLALSVPFIFVVMQVNSERASGQRGYMKLVGLTDFPWWTATTIEHGFYYFMLMALTIVAGYLWYPWMAYFWNCSFLVHLCIYSTYGFSMFTMAMLITTLIRDKKFVVIVAFCVLVFGLSIAFTLMFGDANMFGLWDPGFTHSYGPWGFILSLFPPTALTYAVMAVKLQTWGYVWLVARNANIITGYTFLDMYTVPNDLVEVLNADDWYVPTVNYFLVLMFLNGMLYLLLALYFDQVLEDPYRASQPKSYFLKASYWGCKSRKKKQKNSVKHAESKGLLDERELSHDEDVQAEIERAKYGDAALRVKGLVRRFKGKRKFPCCGPRQPGLTAVNHLYLTADNGTLLCILGHNGAGKTTAINIMTGVTRATGGKAYIFNSSVTTNMEYNRKVMGVCPQFDVLWDDLTAREHLFLISGLKADGMISHEQAGHYLDDVRLLTVADSDAKTYSGGMKRRLSLAMSICTDPKVVFMDEPTTGMDPGNRRHIWETILKIRKGRLVVLTTHSMEEADVLGDKIAIMSRGKLKCIGNSLHLKTKYGCGYRLSLVTADHQSERVINMMHDLLPEATLQTSNAGNLVFSLDTRDLDKSAKAFAELRSATYEDAGSQMELPLINDWGIANTTLEDVFIQTTHEEEEEEALEVAKSLNGATPTKDWAE
mmetsp:Transcript_9738/g.39585  ORF Transcript_9738/g.39585 Transcript_9738/m.39585 type:complete len:910 (-) Transcript_9738:2726-5455(-)